MGRASRRDNGRQAAATHGRDSATRRWRCFREVLTRLWSGRRRVSPLARKAPGREAQVSTVLRTPRRRPKGKDMERKNRIPSRGPSMSRISENGYVHNEGIYYNSNKSREKGRDAAHTVAFTVRVGVLPRISSTRPVSPPPSSGMRQKCVDFAHLEGVGVGSPAGCQDVCSWKGAETQPQTPASRRSRTSERYSGPRMCQAHPSEHIVLQFNVLAEPREKCLIPSFKVAQLAPFSDQGNLMHLEILCASTRVLAFESFVSPGGLWGMSRTRAGMSSWKSLSMRGQLSVVRQRPLRNGRISLLCSNGLDECGAPAGLRKMARPIPSG
jgi:hypothetical protein